MWHANIYFRTLFTILIRKMCFLVLVVASCVYKESNSLQSRCRSCTSSGDGVAEYPRRCVQAVSRWFLGVAYRRAAAAAPWFLIGDVLTWD
jgi:hypothetical protein